MANRIVNAIIEPDEHEQRAPRQRHKITPEMISAAAEVLLGNPFYDFSPGIAESIAEEMLEHALGAPHGGISEDVNPTYHAAMEELFAYFEANKPPQVVLSTFGAVLENPVKLLCGVGNADPSSRIGTMSVKPGLYASDLLVKLLEAVRARDWKTVVSLFEHASSPPLIESN